MKHMTRRLHSVSKVTSEEIEGSTEKLTEQSAALEALIKELDKVVVEATAQR